MALCYAGSVIWQNFVSYYPLICGTVLSAFCFFYLLFDFTEFFLIRYVLVRSLCAFGTCGYCRMDNDNRSFDRCAVPLYVCRFDCIGRSVMETVNFIYISRHFLKIALKILYHKIT